MSPLKSEKETSTTTTNADLYRGPDQQHGLGGLRLKLIMAS